MLKLDFIGKNVLVVGGGRGIGKACALNYADCGANIFIGNRNEEQGKSTVEEIKKMGARADFCRADISKKEDAVALPRWNSSAARWMSYCITPALFPPTTFS